MVNNLFNFFMLEAIRNSIRNSRSNTLAIFAAIFNAIFFLLPIDVNEWINNECAECIFLMN